MIRRTVLLVLATASLGLTGCALVEAPFKLMGGLIKAGGRTMGLGAENTPRQPLRLDTGELERARQGAPLPALPPENESPAERVASR